MIVVVSFCVEWFCPLENLPWKWKQHRIILLIIYIQLNTSCGVPSENKSVINYDINFSLQRNSLWVTVTSLSSELYWNTAVGHCCSCVLGQVIAARSLPYLWNLPRGMRAFNVRAQGHIVEVKRWINETVKAVVCFLLFSFRFLSLLNFFVSSPFCVSNPFIHVLCKYSVAVRA